MEIARDVGGLLGRRRLTLIFGGSAVGLMGAIANAALRAGGRAVGVIPRDLWDLEVGHRGLSDLHIVEDAAGRKIRMAELADSFMILPGGLASVEEFFDIWGDEALDLRCKPFGILNAGGYYDGLVQAIDAMTGRGLIRPAHRRLLHVASRPSELLSELAGHSLMPAMEPTHGLRLI